MGQEKTVKKLPIGLMPQRLWWEERLNDINQAIRRYKEAGVSIPFQWISEKQFIEHWLSEKD